jgi:hypothetical protein
LTREPNCHGALTLAASVGHLHFQEQQTKTTGRRVMAEMLDTEDLVPWLIAFGYDEIQAYKIAATFRRKVDERNGDEAEYALSEADLREMLQEAIDEQAA